MIENLPEEVFELGKQLPVQIRKRFVSMMEMWGIDRKAALQPEIAGHRLRCPWDHWTNPAIAHGDADGVHDRAGARVRHSLPVDGHSLRRREIVIGKMLPYLVVSASW